MEKKHRERGENWTSEEKEIFIEIMKESGTILKNKSTETNIIKQKQAEWLKVQNRHQELSGKRREVAQLKGIWRRMKLTAKRNLRNHKKALNVTGGGQKPPSPSEEDIKIICRTDFKIEQNKYSDRIKADTNDIKAQEKMPVEDVLYVNEDLNENRESSVEGDVADIHNNEVTTTITVPNKTLPVENHQPLENTPKSCNDIDRENHRLTEDIMNIENNKIYTQLNQSDIHTIEKKENINSVEIKHYNNDSGRAAVITANLNVKKRSMMLMEEEYSLRIRYQKQELSHQQLRHEMEIELLSLEKEKKILEIQMLKKKLE